MFYFRYLFNICNKTKLHFFPYWLIKDMRCKTLLKDHFWFHPADIHSVIWNLREKTYKILICTLNSCEAVRPFGDKQDRKSTQETNDTEWSSWMHLQGLTLILAPQNPVSRGGLWSNPVKTTPVSSCLPFEPWHQQRDFLHPPHLTNKWAEVSFQPL